MLIPRRVVALCAVVALTACGSGSDSSNDRSTPRARTSSPDLSAPRISTPGTFTAPRTAVEATPDDKAHAQSVALASAEVTGLVAGRELVADSVSTSGATGFIQVHLRLVNGEATLTGSWPHVVVTNPAECETCTIDGPLKWRIEVSQAAYTVEALIVNVDPSQWAVREVLPYPMPGAPVPAPTPAPG